MHDYSMTHNRVCRVLEKKHFFVCGAIKSGTTWLQIVLDGHPEIACRGEGHFVDILGKNLMKAFDQYNKVVAEKNRTIFSEIDGFPTLRNEEFLYLLRMAVGCQMARYASDGRVSMIGEKTPDNLRYLPQLLELFPHAKFIHIIRDGRDAAISGWYHNLRVSPDWAKKKFGSLSAFAVFFANHWKREIEGGQEFGARNPDLYYELTYEGLSRNPFDEISAILGFLGVSTSDNIVGQCCKSGSFETLSGGRKIGEVDNDSHFRSGMSEQWRTELDAETLQKFQNIAGSLLDRYDYASP